MGHAEYAKHGEDILCSAVTAISATVISALTDLVQIKVDYVLEEGHIRFDVSASDSYMGEDVQLLMETALLGVKQLALNPDYEAHLEIIDD